MKDIKKQSRGIAVVKGNKERELVFNRKLTTEIVSGTIMVADAGLCHACNFIISSIVNHNVQKQMIKNIIKF